jgi:hypothetical protein
MGCEIHALATSLTWEVLHDRLAAGGGGGAPLAPHLVRWRVRLSTVRVCVFIVCVCRRFTLK